MLCKKDQSIFINQRIYLNTISPPYVMQKGWILNKGKYKTPHRQTMVHQEGYELRNFTFANIPLIY